MYVFQKLLTIIFVDHIGAGRTSQNNAGEKLHRLHATPILVRIAAERRSNMSLVDIIDTMKRNIGITVQFC